MPTRGEEGKGSWGTHAELGVGAGPALHEDRGKALLEQRSHACHAGAGRMQLRVRDWEMGPDMQNCVDAALWCARHVQLPSGRKSQRKLSQMR